MNPLAIFGLLLAATAIGSAQSEPLLRPLHADYQPSFGKLRDTLFLLDSTYLEVRIDQQAIYQHFRNGRVEKFLCSTGNPTLKDGIATRPGIYSIQWKAKKYLSQQFDVYLNYWMPFDGGIGFHGLQGRAYYRHLGRAASSHGCVRVSNETGAKIFGTVGRGTLVYVHSGNPARLIAFADSTLKNVRIMDEIDGDLLSRRLDAVLAGRLGDTLLAARIALAPRARFVGRIGVGMIDRHLVAQSSLQLIDIWRLPSMDPEKVSPGPALPSPTLTDQSSDRRRVQHSDS